MTFPMIASKKIARKLALASAFALPIAMISAVDAPKAHAGVYVQIGIAPPVLPVYVQPPLPGDGYLWTPGYWAYGDEGYYWVPGVWVRPPQIGFLWTPAYWGWEGGFYRFHGGYWGPHVGYYGGINYGFGYGGVGFGGGYWRGGGFFYNRSVANFGGVHVTNVYNQTVVVNNHSTVSYNGGKGGINYHPNAQETQYTHENHVQPTGEQTSHQQVAASTPGQRFSQNHGNPAVRAAATPTAFKANPTNPTAAARPTVNGREGNQDQRIANGVKSGQMTSGEAARADQRQANIDRQVHNDRTANGGALTGQERQQVDREQNGASRQIYNEKHNDNTDRGVQPRAQAAPQSRPAPAPRAQPAARQEPAPRQESHPAAAPREERKR